MPTIEVDLPSGLERDVRAFAISNHTDVNTLIIWAVAEQVGELKHALLSKALSFETLVDKYVPILTVKPQDNFLLHIEFDGGLTGNYDMKPLIQRGGVFTALTNQELFGIVKVGGHGEYIQWPGGISIGADTLFAEVILDGNFSFKPSQHEGDA